MFGNGVCLGINLGLAALFPGWWTWACAAVPAACLFWCFGQSIRLRYRLREIARRPADPPWATGDCSKPFASRAYRLLLDNLTPQQREEYIAKGFFTVAGNATGHRYFVGDGMFVWDLDEEGKYGFSGYGFFPSYRRDPSEYLPKADVLLAQKLALETDEDHVRRIACRA